MHCYRNRFKIFPLLGILVFVLTFREVRRYMSCYEICKPCPEDSQNYEQDFNIRGEGIRIGPLNNVKAKTIEPKEDDEEKTRRLHSLLKHMLDHHPAPVNQTFNFNTSHSHGISLTRDLPDVRSQHCRDIKYDIKTLPKVSIVSPFYNEDLTVLLRHVHSLLRHSPRDLLQEIILVDDKSTLSYLGPHLDDYLSILDSRIVLIRNKKREGLARTRNIGARAATQEVVVFLDSHMEFNVGWLEPLVSRLASRTKLVVQPHVVTIPGMERGQPERLMRSAFGWDLRLSMYFIPPYLQQTQTSSDDPIPTPGLVGCAVAVNREYFLENGAFDPYLELWGAEHFELSFRTWMCGGRVEVVPCSKVAHLFRRPPYLHGKDAMETVLRNIFRVAVIWMDEYKEIVFAALKGFYQKYLILPNFNQVEMFAEHKLIRRPNHCKSFDWFISHVMPEAGVPSRDAIYYGEVLHESTSLGLSVTEDNHIGVTSIRTSRAISVPSLYFTIDKYGRFVHMNKCVYIENNTQILKLNNEKCYNVNSTFSWSLEKTRTNGGRIVYTDTDQSLCLTHVWKSGVVVLEPCNLQNKNQIWTFSYHFNWNAQ